MGRYLLQSTALHAVFLGLFFGAAFFKKSAPIYWIDGFQIEGPGGGGGEGGLGGGPKKEQMGQVVPQPALQGSQVEAGFPLVLQLIIP